MAVKKTEAATTTTGPTGPTGPVAGTGPTGPTAPTTSAGLADPGPATELTEASGAIIEPAIAGRIDVAHPSIDANPREGTSAAQNQIDMNDPARRTPNDTDFEGLGLDPTPYGKSKA